MASFSFAFPSSLTEISINNHLRAGAVLRIYCSFTTPPKFKFVMIANLEPLEVFIINSEMPPYIQNTPDLLADQIDIPQHDHPFLEHDSILNCIEAHRTFNISDLKQEMAENFSQIYKGKLKPYLLRNVLNVVENSVNLSPIVKSRIINAINRDNVL